MRIELNITGDNWQEAAQTVRETLSHLHLGPPASNRETDATIPPAIEAFSSSTHTPDSTPSSSPSTNTQDHASHLQHAALGYTGYTGTGENFYPADPKANIAAKPWMMSDVAPIMFISTSVLTASILHRYSSFLNDISSLTSCP